MISNYKTVQKYVFKHEDVSIETFKSDRGISWDDAEQKRTSLSTPTGGYYSNLIGSRATICLAVKSESGYAVYYPGIGLSMATETYKTLKEKTKITNISTANKMWNEEYSFLFTNCRHEY